MKEYQARMAAPLRQMSARGVGLRNRDTGRFRFVCLVDAQLLLSLLLATSLAALVQQPETVAELRPKRSLVW